MILQIQTERTGTQYMAMDVSWLSGYPSEHEYLLFDHQIRIQSWVASSAFDDWRMSAPPALMEQVRANKNRLDEKSRHAIAKIVKNLPFWRSLL